MENQARMKSHCRFSSIDRDVAKALGPEEFRSYVRGWLRAALVEFTAYREANAGTPDYFLRRAWEGGLCVAGWSGLGWPARYGGLELQLEKQAIFFQEVARARALRPVNFVGHGILGPTLLHHGSEEQRQRFLAPLLRNDEIWCQGYSEPGAGSDLASLRTRAVRDGDLYRVNGQKIWTTYAQYSDWCFLLARTDPAASKHHGLSFLLVKMDSPGIRVRPIRQITGEDEFNEVFFDEVEIPAENLVGAENDGWRVAMTAANFERATYFLPHIARMRYDLADIAALAGGRARGRQSPAATAVVNERLVDGFIDLRALEFQTHEMLRSAQLNGDPGPGGALVKLLWSESRQKLFELAIELLDDGLDDPEPSEARDWRSEYLRTRSETILAGASEIQRNIIAERVLKLPRQAVR
jgi:alkylation response protein AidB-like acyl-CoA dehydrogenase